MPLSESVAPQHRSSEHFSLHQQELARHGTNDATAAAPHSPPQAAAATAPANNFDCDYIFDFENFNVKDDDNDNNDNGSSWKKRKDFFSGDHHPCGDERRGGFFCGKGRW